MYDLLKSAQDDVTNKNYSFFLSGDLCQMATQRDFLNSRNIQTRQNNVYPCLRECDVEKALTLIWKSKTEGWWHYKDQYLKYKICTEEEFSNGFKH
jgi:hypothetical protein